MSSVDSEEMGMWDLIVAIAISALLGLLGLGVAVFQIVTLGVAHSLDNLFLTILGLLMAVVGFGYVAAVVAPVFSKKDNKKGKG